MSIALDLKYTARLLLKKPMFTAVTILIVAIGLGLTLYTYSLLSSLVFSPLQLKNAQPIVAIEGFFDYNHLQRRNADPLHLYQLHENSGLIDEIGIYSEDITFLSADNLNSAKKLNAAFVSWNIFEFAGVQPILGRGFSPDDHLEGAESTAVISYDVWQNVLAGAQDVVGTMVKLDATATKVIGVMPEGFAFPARAQLWRPALQLHVAPIEPTYTGYRAFARLKNGASIAQLQQYIAGFNKEIVASLPENYGYRINGQGEYLRAVPYKEAVITQYYSLFIAMLVVVFLILALACINVGNLLLARVNERFKEVAIRVALGVPRNRLVFQMLLESFFICTVGALLAVLFASWGVSLSNQAIETSFAVNGLRPFWWQVSLGIDGISLLIIAVLLMITCTGLFPAWRALSGDFNSVIRDGTRGAVGKNAANIGKLLVISEISLSCVVLVLATILLSTSYRAGQADYGVQTQNRLTAQIQLPTEKYPLRRDTEFEYQDRMNRSKYYYQLKEQLEQSPNVHGVSFMSSFPGTGEGTSHFEIEGRAAQVYSENPYSNNEVVSMGAWDTIGMKILHGRDFDQRDAQEDARSIIINESIAREFFPNGDAVGQRIRRVWRTDQAEWETIIGVVSDTYHGSTMSASSASYNSYHLMDPRGFSWMYVAIHFSGNFEDVSRNLQQAAADIDADVGVYQIQSYDSLIKQPMMLILAVSKVFVFCGVVAVFLAASGIFAVASNNILQRAQEIGVRRALGSSDAEVMQLFFKQAILQLAIGLALGVAMSAWLANFIADTMIIDQTSYLMGMLGVPILIISIVLLATYIPTRKMVVMEPSYALHYN
ncbi:ABC transporter permease [Thalassotalea fusca]